MLRRWGLLMLLAAASAHGAVALGDDTCAGAEVCYVNGGSTKCDRTSTECPPCIGEMSSSKYSCYSKESEGDCPDETQECSATLSGDDDDDDDDESSTTTTSTTSTTPTPTTKTPTATTKTPTTTKPATTTAPSTTSTSTSSPSTSTSTSSTSTTSSPSTTSTSSGSAGADSSRSTATSTDTTTSSDTTKSSSTDEESGNGTVKPQTETVLSTADTSSDASSNTANTTAANASTNDASSPNDTESTSPTTSASRESGSKSTSITGKNSSRTNLGLILGVIGTLVVVGAIFGFVVWRRKQSDDDDEFDDAVANGATFAAPLSQPNVVPAKTTFASQNYIHKGNATVPPVEPASLPIAAIDFYSPSALDSSRRTDSILGGSGVSRPTDSLYSGSHISFTSSAGTTSDWGEPSESAAPNTDSDSIPSTAPSARDTTSVEF